MVLDPYEWLPGYGESAVRVSRNPDGDLVVTIEYDGAERTEAKDLCFAGACAVHMASYPGPPMLDISYETGPDTDKLVEYTRSEAARAWTAHFEHLRPIRHFRVVFLSENKVIEVFATDVTIRDAVARCASSQS